MAKEKDGDGKAMLRHGLGYLVAIAVASLPFFVASFWGWLCIAVVPILHFDIDMAKGWLLAQGKRRKEKDKGKDQPLKAKRKLGDWIKSRLLNPAKEKTKDHWREKIGANKAALFFADQALHILIIVFIAWVCATRGDVALSGVGIGLEKFYDGLQLSTLSSEKFVRLGCLFLFLGKPVSAAIPRIIRKRKDKGQADAKDDAKAGRMIGVLERYLTVVFMLMGQYTAIGFVFAAKSAARFSKILDNQEFAEQYLVGTMSSLLFAIVGAVLYMAVP